MRNLTLGAVLGATLPTGCAATGGRTHAAATVAQAPASSTAPAPGTVLLTGDLRSPGPVTAAKLTALPQHTVAVQYAGGTGTTSHTETGVLLADLLPPDALATTAHKNDLLSFAVLAVGADGYTALVSYGEVSPDFGNRGTLLATSEDGAALDRPRLVVPGDVKGGRYVSDVVELRVVRAAA